MEDKNKVKEILLGKIEEIKKELSALGHIVQGDDFMLTIRNHEAEHADSLDAANLIEEQQENIAVFNVIEERYEQVKKALAALEDGKYGICEECSVSIGEQRLGVNPSATTCITHAK